MVCAQCAVGSVGWCVHSVLWVQLDGVCSVLWVQLGCVCTVCCGFGWMVCAGVCTQFCWAAVGLVGSVGWCVHSVLWVQLDGVCTVCCWAAVGLVCIGTGKAVICAFK
jgi:hypothetical protein